ncbi:MAG: thioesterase family protein, partial [Actinomycetia bacterium]|nr:thioesterase family protein [Actinomycetes bacterium]
LRSRVVHRRREPRHADRSTMTYEFDDAIATLGTNNEVVLPERWTMGPGFAHGGYLMSVALTGAAAMASKPDPITMSAHFVRPGRVGKANVASRLIKSGRSLATVGTDIVQGGEVVIATITTFGDLTEAGDILFQSVTRPDLAPLDACIPVPSGDSSLVPRMSENLDLRLTPDSTAWTTGERLENATMCGWIRFADGRPIDTVSLPMFADALPPPVFNVGSFAPWTPTIELTIHIRRRPETEWLAMSFHTDLIGGTFFESSGTLWDDDGRLVAMSRQLQLIQRS